MKKFVLILGLILSMSVNAMADVCYDIEDKVAQKAIDIIKTQKEIYEYCSICHDAEPKNIPVTNIQKGNPIYVNDIALDLAHTYYKKDNKFINLGVASGCIEDGEYNIEAELENLTNTTSKKIKIIEQNFTQCANFFESEEQKCPELWSIKCYNHLMQAHKNIQRCYKKVAVELFYNYYNLTEKKAKEKVNALQKVISEQYTFIYNENTYCRKNNCGVSLNLYSEYATTQELYNYINKIITFVANQ